MNDYGLYIVTTPTTSLHIGDVVRVVWQEPPNAFAYAVRHHGRDVVGKAYLRLPLSCLFAKHMPVMIHAFHEMEPFLVRAPHLVPDGGWLQFLHDAAIGTRFEPPHSWQFYAKCWHDDVSTGKTGGLHMSMHKHVRRSQLMVEYGVCGDSLLNTLPHTKQGILMYVGCMSAESASRTGDLCYDNSLALSFTALLVAYVETVSLVRRAVYEHLSHPYGGVDYAARQWDYAHTPYTVPFPIASQDHRPARTINIAEFARRKSRQWIEAESIANPVAWSAPVTTVDTNIRVGQRAMVRLARVGVRTWVHATVTSCSPLQFDVPVDRGSYAIINSRIVVT